MSQNLIEQVLEEEDRNKPLAVGDLVHLKSGGPTMTIRSMSKDNVECEWFDKSAIKKHSFKITSLRRGPYSRLPILNMNFGTQSDDKPPWEHKTGSNK